MKKNLTLITSFLLMVSFISCTKNNIDKERGYDKNQVDGRENSQDSLFLESSFYAKWHIDSIHFLQYRTENYTGGGDIYLTFTNKGKVICENKTNYPIKAEILGTNTYDTAAWYCNSGTEKFSVILFYPSNEFTLKRANLPFSGGFYFTDKNEYWASHFSNKKMEFYKMKSGNATVRIWGTKVN